MLGGILSTAELVGSRARNSRDQQDLAAIAAQAARAGALVRQLLAFSRQELLRPEPLRLATLVDGLRPTLAALVRPPAQLVLLLDHDAPASADRLAIERVLINLVTNAREALGDAPGVVQVATGRMPHDGVPAHARAFMTGGPWSILTVADDGPGVSPAIRPRLFQPYVSGKPGGQGLGLASAFGLVKQSGGYLLHEVGPLGGAAFTVALPETAGIERVAAPAAPGGQRHILLAEDDPLLRIALARALAAAGHRVAEAADGAAALAAFEADPSINCLVADVRMPGMDGIALTHAIRARAPGFPVLLMSGQADAAPRAALASADVHFLAKPFRLAALVAAIP